MNDAGRNEISERPEAEMVRARETQVEHCRRAFPETHRGLLARGLPVTLISSSPCDESAEIPTASLGKNSGLEILAEFKRCYGRRSGPASIFYTWMMALDAKGAGISSQAFADRQGPRPPGRPALTSSDGAVLAGCRRGHGVLLLAAITIYRLMAKDRIMSDRNTLLTSRGRFTTRGSNDVLWHSQAQALVPLQKDFSRIFTGQRAPK